jgi:hypothetical protein
LFMHFTKIVLEILNENKNFNISGNYQNCSRTPLLLISSRKIVPNQYLWICSWVVPIMILIWCSWTLPWTVLNLFMGFTKTVLEILNETKILRFQELPRIVQEHICSWLIQEF